MPTNSAMHPANSGHASRLTPSNSPFSKYTGPRQPQKAMHLEPRLTLRRVIGTTTCAPNGFDCLPTTRSFAYTAGAAAIVSTLDEDLEIKQRFFTARPAAVAINSTPSAYGTSTPGGAPQETRNRTVGSLRDAGLGHSPLGSTMGEWGESPASKTWTARERIKAATCVSLSSDGKFLAVGETGYNPRVLIYSLTDDGSQDIPLTIISEHTFGIRCVAFSPDSRYLASLGAVNDGFLYIWSVNSKSGAVQLHSSNKCSSYVKAMIWMGNKLVTVGTRHVKVWKPDEGSVPHSPLKQRSGADGTLSPVPVNSAPKTLHGRNALLGSLVDVVFTSAAMISDDHAIVCSERGDICVLDDSDSNQRLVQAREVDFRICSVAVNPTSASVWIAGKHGELLPFSLNDLKRPKTPDTPLSSPSPSLCNEDRTEYRIAMACVGRHIISINSSRSITIFDTEATDDRTIPNSIIKDVPAHRNAVMGVKLLETSNPLAATFFTWSVEGTVRFWDLEGKCKGEIVVGLEQSFSDDDDNFNELRVVLASPTTDFFVSGDKSGVLRLIDGATLKTSHVIQAHGGEVMDIVMMTDDSITLVASSSRDRTIQLFKTSKNALELVQTLDDHVGAIGGVIFSAKGDKLISCSSDRTILIRELVTSEVDGETSIAFLLTRTITLKTTPLSMTLIPEQSNSLIVSTADKNVQKFDIKTGRVAQTFRALDSEGNDPVIMDALVIGKISSFSKSVLGGISTTDKSVRLYDHKSGTLLDKASGHTEGVTDVALHQTEDGKTTLISTGSDGTIMIWDYSISPTPQQETLDTGEQGEHTPAVKESISSKNPLRRVLSKSELAEWHRSSDAQNAGTTTSHSSPPRQVRKKTSKYSLAQTTRTPPVPNIPFKYNSPTPSRAGPISRKSLQVRSDPSPSPPTTTALSSRRSRRPSTEPRNRSKSSGSAVTGEFGSLNAATEQACRSLRAYRKRLDSAAGDAPVRVQGLKELEKELQACLKVVGDRISRIQGGEREGNVEGLLEGYSERLVELIERKVEARIGRGVGVGGEKEGEEEVLGHGDGEKVEVSAGAEDEWG